MSTTRPNNITIIAVSLIILALISASSLLTTPSMFGGTRPQGRIPGNPPSGGNAQGDNGNFQGQGQGGNVRQRNNTGGFNLFSITRTLGLGGQVMGYINIGIAVAGAALTLLSAWGVWKQKRWALNLAMIIAVICLIGAVPGLFSIGGRFINWFQVGQRALSTAASLVILFLGILPSVRDSVS
ncbi:MAG: hypothetical protein EHM81_06540 [Chloroflexi bacterium]|nr:MAG: hypothetical protein EHM81_06540 [Chloroflexota bacterium]